LKTKRDKLSTRKVVKTTAFATLKLRRDSIDLISSFFSDNRFPSTCTRKNKKKNGTDSSYFIELVSLQLSFYKFSNSNRLDLGAKELRNQKTGKNMRGDSMSFLSKDYSRTLMTSTTREE
jgi:hypothetical protein